LSKIFPDRQYQFDIRLETETIPGFFSGSEQRPALLEQKEHWLRHDSASTSLIQESAAPLLDEWLTLCSEQGLMEKSLLSRLSDSASLQEKWNLLGRSFEHDLLLLRLENDQPRLIAGSVCFPSSWNLSEKMGRQLSEIHAVVPGLNPALGAKINTFLSRMRPGQVWTRENWGLSHSPELNQHPDRSLPKLSESTAPEEIWVRIERQGLLALPKSGGVLFAIGIECHALDFFRRNENLRIGLLIALQSMPVEMAQYKGITFARDNIISFLSVS